MTSNTTTTLMSCACCSRANTLRLIARVALGVVFLVWFSTFVHAWSNPGHMAVALVAYRKLNATMRTRVDALVALNPKIDEWRAQLPTNVSAARKREMLFMIAATWADQIKGDGEHDAEDGLNGNPNVPPNDGTGDDNLGYNDDRKRKYWHYKDVGFSSDGTTVLDAPAINAGSEIELFRQVLASNAEDGLKSYDLVWLMHLVGDVHQPLHCTARFTHSKPHGDDGGNGITICDGNTCTNSNRGTLHSFWDGLFGSTPNLKKGIGVASALVTNLPAAPANKANDLNTSHWIDEGFNLAKVYVYRFPIDHGNTIWDPSAYRSDAISVGVKQISLAGTRLANVLNSELR